MYFVQNVSIFDKEPVSKHEIKLLLQHREENIKVFLVGRTNHNQFLVSLSTQVSNPPVVAPAPTPHTRSNVRYPKKFPALLLESRWSGYQLSQLFHSSSL